MRKFLNEFAHPTFVVHKESETTFEHCRGFGKYANGWFSILDDDTITLYNELGQMVENNLADVYVFRTGHILKRKNNCTNFSLINPKGDVCMTVDDAEVFSDHLFGIHKKENLWDIYTLEEEYRQIFSNLEAEHLDIYPYIATDNAENLVLKVVKNQINECWLVEGKHYTVKQKIRQAKNILALPFFRFAISDEMIAVSGHGDNCVMAEVCGDIPMDVLNKFLLPLALNVHGVIAYDNGLYLLKDEMGCWSLYNKETEKIFTNIYSLHFYESSEGDVPCMLIGQTNQSKQASIYLLDNGMLKISYDGQVIWITEDGELYTDDSSSGSIFIF